MFNNPANINDRQLMSLQVPAVCGLGRVNSIAKAYGLLAVGGEALAISSETIRHFQQPAVAPRDGTFDQVLRAPMSYSLGYVKPCDMFQFGSDERAFGTHGAGGSFAYADPGLEAGFAYAMNRMDFYVFGDPRERSLREAMERSIRNLGYR